MGIVMLSSGPVSIACGLVFALRFPGAVGDVARLRRRVGAPRRDRNTPARALFIDTGEIQPASTAAAIVPPPLPMSSATSVDTAAAVVDDLPPPLHDGLSSEKMAVAPESGDDL